MESKENIKPIKVFISYAHKDEAYKNELITHLSILKRQGYITEWTDRKIKLGNDWKKEINNSINTSEIILLLISPDFIASDYCYGIELEKALELHEVNKSVLVPIVIRPVDWEDETISKLQGLPKDALPVSTWNNQDEAWIDVAKGIRSVVLDINKQKQRSENNVGLISVKNHLKEEIKRLEKRYEQPSACGGISTGYKILDNCIDGIHETDFVVIAARPLMGRTDFLVNLIINIGVEQNIPLAFFSMKLPTDQITRRLLCTKARINHTKVIRCRLVESDWPKLTYSAGAVSESKIYIDDNTSLNIDDIETKIRAAKIENGIKLVVIDSLYHISYQQQNNNPNYIFELTRRIKLIAKELKIPIIATAPVARDVDFKVNKCPTINDLNEWYSVMEDADVVSFLYCNSPLYDDYDEYIIKDLVLVKNIYGNIGAISYKYETEYNLYLEQHDSDD